MYNSVLDMTDADIEEWWKDLMSSTPLAKHEGPGSIFYEYTSRQNCLRSIIAVGVKQAKQGVAQPKSERGLKWLADHS